MEQIDKRMKIVELISRTLERDNLLNMRQSRMFVNNIWYEKLINEKQWDILLECFIKSLGLEFKLYLEGLDDWKGNLYESSGGSLLKEMREWERIIKGQSHLSRKLTKEETEQKSAYSSEIGHAIQRKPAGHSKGNRPPVPVISATPVGA